MVLCVLLYVFTIYIQSSVQQKFCANWVVLCVCVSLSVINHVNSSKYTMKRRSQEHWRAECCDTAVVSLTALLLWQMLRL